MFAGVAGVTGTNAAAKKTKYNPKADAIMSISAFKRMGRVHYHHQCYLLFAKWLSYFSMGA